MRRHVALALLAGSLAGSACADDAVQDSTARRASATRREMVALRQMTQQAAQPEAPPWTLTIGAAGDASSDAGHTWTTPFILQYAFDPTWALQLSGDGVSHVWPRNGGPSAEGFADVKIDGLYSVTKTLAAQVGVVLPTHGSQGSAWGSERAKLSYESADPCEAGHPQGSCPGWLVGWAGTLRHFDNQATGKSRLATVGYGEFGYQFAEGRRDLVTATWSHQTGTATTLDLGLEHDFPLTTSMSGVLTVVHGFTNSTRHNGAELDLVLKF